MGGCTSSASIRQHALIEAAEDLDACLLPLNESERGYILCLDDFEGWVMLHDRSMLLLRWSYDLTELYMQRVYHKIVIMHADPCIDTTDWSRWGRQKKRLARALEQIKQHLFVESSVVHVDSVRAELQAGTAFYEATKHKGLHLVTASGQVCSTLVFQNALESFLDNATACFVCSFL